jgi:anti-sigma regulatory factor (Ser/Thr protein kinase)
MRGQDPASLELRLPAQPEYGRLLRERLRLWLETAGLVHKDIFEIALATIEAFSNAVEHPQEPRSRLVRIQGAITDHTVTLSIRDYGRWRSEQTRKEDGGLGLILMEQLMDSVQVDRLVEGTTVTMRRHLSAG